LDCVHCEVCTYFVTYCLYMNQVPGKSYLGQWPYITEWVRDCCLSPTQQFFSYFMATVHVYSKNLSSQYSLTAQIKQVQDKIVYWLILDMTLYVEIFFVTVISLWKTKFLTVNKRAKGKSTFLFIMSVICKCFRSIKYIRWGSHYQKGENWNQIYPFNMSQFCARPTSGPWFPLTYIVVFFVYNDLKWE
jgi:hypothetical protein